jgi:hypothetical protein
MMSCARMTATALNPEISGGKGSMGLRQRRLSVLLAALGWVVAGRLWWQQGVSPMLVCGSAGKAGV